ncbi:hypothetical protein OESDEN_11766 [Oesophagostomum dentatum]|uniref:Uncharacterized protein n=1 Tax=Oesophagostomum dentatum TaxID=61180 RepID=A0A0B1SZ14_OESDE|nr:hypothetical protein OESDEN_11766 [Oesophagostomum dentatum]
MEEPYDWELGYENLSGRGRANGNISARLKSHTTAVIRDQRFEDKNRALDTQAPITMGEDEDEQTNGQCPQIGHQGESGHDKHEKPKYKRHEFLKPKVGTVNMDVIDAVNARLAACDDNLNDNDVEVGIDFIDFSDICSNFSISTPLIQANFNLPYTILRPQIAETSASPNKAIINPIDKTNKSNKSITISLNKRYSKKLPTTGSSDGAIADELSGVNRTAATSAPSRWHDRVNLLPPARCEPPPNPQPMAPQVLSPSNHYSPLAARRPSIKEQPRAPMHRTHSAGAPQSSSIISHFKGLINTFNNLGCGSRLTRGVSVDESARAQAEQDRDSGYKMRNSASTGLRILPAVASTKVVATVDAQQECNDDEKEQRRLRRLRRRSVEGSGLRVSLTNF